MMVMLVLVYGWFIPGSVVMVACVFGNGDVDVGGDNGVDGVQI